MRGEGERADYAHHSTTGPSIFQPTDVPATTISQSISLRSPQDHLISCENQAEKEAREKILTSSKHVHLIFTKGYWVPRILSSQIRNTEITK